MTSLPTLIRAGDLFDKLGREDEQPADKKIEVRRGNVEKLLKIFQEVLQHNGYHFDDMDDYGEFSRQYFRQSQQLLRIKRMRPKTKDIQDFLRVVWHSTEKVNSCDLGSYISACITQCRDKEIKLAAAYFREPPLILGMNNNGKKITIAGKTKERIGSDMKNGEIILMGDTESLLGAGMSGGKIVIYGHAGFRAGWFMHGGRIEVFGNAGKDVGYEMYGGEIYLHGHYESIHESCEGKIYHHGKLVMKDGRLVE